jgi:hypothetical protein
MATSALTTAQKELAGQSTRAGRALDGVGNDAKYAYGQVRALEQRISDLVKLSAPLDAMLSKVNDQLRHQAALARESANAMGELARAQANAAKGSPVGKGSVGPAARPSSDQIGKLGGAISSAVLGVAKNDAQSIIGGVAGIAEVFASASAEGVGFSAVLAGLAAEAAPIAAIAAPIAIVGGLLALGAGRALENEAAFRSFNAQLALNVDGLKYNAQTLAETSSELTHYGLSAEDARKGLSTFIKDGVDPARLKDFSIAAENLSEVLGGDVKSAQESVSNAFTSGYDAVAKLDGELNFLTVSQRDHIQAMFAAGHASEAQAEAFAIFARQVDDAAAKSRGPWQDAVRELSGAWNDFLDDLANSDAIQGVVAMLEGLMGAVTAALKMGGDGKDKGKPGSGPTTTSGMPSFVQFMPVPVRMAVETLDAFGRSRKQENAQRTTADTKTKSGHGEGNETNATDKAFGAALDALKQQKAALQPISNADRIARAGNREVERVGVAVKGISEGQINQIRNFAEDIERTKIARENTGRGRVDASVQHGPDVEKATQSAIDRAAKDELSARAALTQNIEALAQFRKEQIDQEAREAKKNLTREAGIDPSQLGAIAATIEHTATLKKQAVDQQLVVQQIEKEIQQRSAMAGYADREMQARASMATTLDEAQGLQTKSLAARHAREWDDEKARQQAAKKNGTFDLGDTLARNGGIVAAQKAERGALEVQQARQSAQQALSLTQADHQNKVDLLTSRKALAQSEYEAGRIELQIRDKQYVAQREALEAVTRANGASELEVIQAEKKLPVLEAIYRNERKALELSNSRVKAYSDLVQALSGLAQTVLSGDVGGSISGFSGVLKKASGLLGSDAGLGKLLGQAGNFLGPVGAAVSAVTGVLGAIGQRSAEKAQAKLAALHKGVEDLRAANMASSNSIAGALEQANKTSGADLGYSNAMLASLRSIDSRIGTVANAIARSIKVGGLLDTSSLGLGTTGSTTGSLFGAVGGLLFGNSKTKTELLDQGLVFNPTTYGALTNGGVTGQTYADLVSTTTKKLLGVTTGVKVRTSTVYGGVDEDLMAQITGVIEALGEGVVTAATTFGEAAGQAAQDALAGATIDLGKLSLKDLKPDEIEAAVNAMFDKVADDLAATGVPGLQALAKAGEGAFETLTRLATEYKTIDAALASVGMTFKTGGLGSLEARKGLLDKFGGLDAFTSQTAFFGEHFLTEDDRLKPLKASVATTLTAMGQPADLSREGFKKLAQGQDLSTEDGAKLYAALMALAPAFDKVATAAEAAKTAVDDQRTSIQDQIDELTKSPTELLAKSRAKETKAVEDLDASLVPLLKTLWGLQDAAEAAKLATDRSNAEADMLDAQGFTEQAKAKRRNLALADVKDPDQRTYMQRTWAAEDAAAKVSAARDVLTQAYHDEQDAILKTKDKFKELSDSLKAFSASLSDTIAGADLATRYRTTRQSFQATASLARIGNEDAMRRLQAEGEAFTSASRDYASTSIDYLRDVGLVRSAVDDAADAADNQVSIADQQLLTLKESLKGLIDVKDGVISVRDAIANLQGALGEARAAGVASVGGSNLGLTPTNTSSPSPTVQRDPTLANANMAWLLTHGMLSAANDTKPDDATKAYIALGNTYQPGYMDIVNTQGIKAANALVDAGKLSFLQGGSLNFATGGGFEVGGSGPPDSKLFNLALSPGEAVNVQRADQKGDRSLITELRRLREELADLRETSVRIANSNDKMERTLTNVTEGGRAMMTEAAA